MQRQIQRKPARRPVEEIELSVPLASLSPTSDAAELLAAIDKLLGD